MKQKIEIIFTVKRIVELDEDENIEDIKSCLSNAPGEYLYGGFQKNENVDVEVRET